MHEKTMGFWSDLGIGLLVIIGMFIVFILIAGAIGLSKSIKSVCPMGQRAINISGSASITPSGVSNIVTPTADYPFCSPRMSCPTEGAKWAVHQDGSALTNNCDVSDCPCSIFQHCPSYASTVFRQFGKDDRISLFQIIDPLAKDPSPPKDPYDVPYLIDQSGRDTCFLTETTINKLWPTLALGEKCIRGTLAKMSTIPSQYVCAPSAYVTNSVFDVSAYMNAYHHS